MLVDHPSASALKAQGAPSIYSSQILDSPAVQAAPSLTRLSLVSGVCVYKMHNQVEFSGWDVA